MAQSLVNQIERHGIAGQESPHQHGKFEAGRQQ
jgi:hypothetical protein